MRMVCLAAILLICLVPSAQGQEKRDFGELSRTVDLYDSSSRRTGHAVIDPRTGRVDFYDARSRRTGYGKIEDGRLERFDLRSRRAGEGRERRAAP